MTEPGDLSLTPVPSEPWKSIRSRLQMHFDIYADQMQALRDIAAATIPHASALDEPNTRFAEFGRIGESIPEPIRPEIAELIRARARGELSNRELTRKLIDDYKAEDGWNYKLVIAIRDLTIYQPRLPMLRNSLLTTAVGSFEATIATIATEFYRYKPEALEANARDREREFSLAELKTFGSIADAIESSVFRRVESLMFGGLADWSKFFRETLKIDLSELAISWPQFQEIIQRRHIIVHNGARASRRYIAQMKAIDPNSDIHEGDKVDCTEEYLEFAIDHLLTLGSLLIMAVIVKFLPKEEVHSFGLHKLSYELLTKGRWEATKRLCTYGMSMPLPQDDVLTFKINKALAEKATGGVTSISKETEAWDVSALSDRFKLAKACLLDRTDEAFKYLYPLVETNDVTTGDLLEWPLFNELRNDSRFTQIMASRLGQTGDDDNAES